MKMYVLVRRDLDSAYRMVQGMHALAQWTLGIHQEKWANETLVCLIVNTESDIARWHAKLHSRGVESEVFCEPDLKDQQTALACATDDERLFSGLRLAPVA